ncbi:hypothetical protein ACU6U9_15865 [Pseudomonas sp. HK3]|jgi:hypothetical protein
MKILMLLLTVICFLFVVWAGRLSFDESDAVKTQHQNSSYDWSDNWMGP